jgi:phosphoglucomutase
VREKDGLWAVLCWLSILGVARKSVSEVVRDHWKRFGRSYYQRHDYEGLELAAATQMVDALRARLASLPGLSLAGSTIAQADDFRYTDPVDGSVSEHQGIRILLDDGSRIVCRLSGTGTEGATLRVYVERYRKDDGAGEIEEVLNPLVTAARELLELRARIGRESPTVIT